jgi:hypothetical protein
LLPWKLSDELWQAQVLTSLAHDASGSDPALRACDAQQICRSAGITDPDKIALALREW